MDKHVKEIVDLINEGGDWRTALITNFDCIKRLGDYRLIETLLAGKVTSMDLVNPLLNGVAIGHYQAAYGTGTPYNLTDTAALLNFGTMDPDITITEPGTYLVRAAALLAAAAATITTQTAALKVRRTNNTAADVSAVLAIDLPAMTTLTHTIGQFVIPEFVYTTVNSDDVLQVFGNLSAAAGAGQIEAVAIGTYIVAERIK